MADPKFDSDRGTGLMARFARPLRIAVWGCLLLIAILALAPGDDMELRTKVGQQIEDGFGLWRHTAGRIEHAFAYLATAFFLARVYAARFGVIRLCAALGLYAGCLELAQNVVPGRNASVWDFLASFGGVVVGSLLYTVYRRWRGTK